MSGLLELTPTSIDFWTELAHRDPAALVDRLERSFEDIEARVRAFTPESGRFSRLAKAMNRADGTSHNLGPLFGVPLGVKDIFRVDGLETRAGSTLPPEIFDGAESAAVTILRRADALVIGKTVSTEFAYFAPGPTRNPFNLDHTPGGSSSGSAAAVAAGLSAVALGTQTIGSISRPASFCGVVGFKPSYNRISTDGVIPLSPSLDHVGTFAGSVRDTRALAALLCSDWREYDSDRRPILGVPQGPYLDRASVAAREHFTQVCSLLGQAGYEVRSVELFSDLEALVETHYRIVAAEAARVHASWFARFADRYHQKTRQLIEQGAGVSDSDLAELLGSLPRLRSRVTEAMARHQIDLWISPAAPGGAPEGLQSTGDPIMNLPWTHAGLPTLSVPAGSSSAGLPIGLQIAGGWWQDEKLLHWGIALEGTLR